MKYVRSHIKAQFLPHRKHTPSPLQTPEDTRLIIIIIVIFINCNWVVTGGSGYFTCIQNMKLDTEYEI
jgi:hypothetical protein